MLGALVLDLAADPARDRDCVCDEEANRPARYDDALNA